MCALKLAGGQLAGESTGGQNGIFCQFQINSDGGANLREGATIWGEPALFWTTLV